MERESICSGIQKLACTKHSVLQKYKAVQNTKIVKKNA